ncbi:MAG: AI-2E family transporter [Bacteroidota bacterium]|nr:AI-2E family transporter [Bacteroidota bacterium]
MKPQFPGIIKLTNILLFAILLFYVLIVARHFLSPIVLAMVFAFMLFPFTRFLERRKIPRVLANLIGILILISILTVIIHLIFRNAQSLLADLPNLKAQAHINIDKMTEYVYEHLGVSIHSQKKFFKDTIGGLFQAGGDFTNSIFSATTGTIFKLGILPVFMFYMLLYRDKLYDFILMSVPEEKIQTTDKIIKEITRITPRYIGGVFTVVLILCVLNSIGLYIIGLKYALLFGILSALFNFIPYFGTWIGASLPFTFALLTGDSPQLALMVLVLFVIIQFTENNVLTPNITGGYVSLNPFFTILIIIIGGMVWSVIGMFVIVPIMAMVKIILDHSKNYKPLAMLIGIERSKVQKAEARKFRRLLTIKKRKIK